MIRRGAWLQGHQGTERLDFKHLGIRESLEIAASVRVGGAGIIFENLDEEGIVQDVGDPPLVVGQADLDRRVAGDLPKKPEPRAKSQPGIREIGGAGPAGVRQAPAAE